MLHCSNDLDMMGNSKIKSLNCLKTAKNILCDLEVGNVEYE